MNNRVKLAVFDVDGTLLHTGNPLSRATSDALSKLYHSGVALALASSRPGASLAALASQVGVPMHLISYNGALVTHAGGKVLQAQCFELDASLAFALRDYVRAGGSAHIYARDQWQAFGAQTLIQREEASTGLRADSRAADVRPDEVTGQTALKIMCNGNNPALMTLRAAAEQRQDIVFVWSGHNYYDIHLDAADKGNALVCLCRYLNIDPKDTVAFGDSDSDASMLATAGRGVAVGHASERALALADAGIAGPGSGDLEEILSEIVARARHS